MCRRRHNHELAHTLLHGDRPDGERELSYPEEELVVESVAFTVCGAIGLDTSGYSVPYLASWSERAELDTVQTAAALIDELHHLPSVIAILALLPDHAGEVELARGFEAGADDLARPPVGYVELRCRMDAVRRRCTQGPGHVRRRRVDGLDIDLVARSASFDERSIALSRLEFDLLAMLATDPRRVFLKSPDGRGLTPPRGVLIAGHVQHPPSDGPERDTAHGEAAALPAPARDAARRVLRPAAHLL